MQPQHSFKILRRFLKEHPDLKGFSTQRGFAEFLDRSLGLIRAVEQGQIKLTQKLANRIQAALGVSALWLFDQHPPSEPIPGKNGDILTHKAVIAKIREATEVNFRRSETVLKTHLKSPADEPVTFVQRLAASTGKAVELALEMTLDQGDSSLLNQINELLLKYATRKTPHTEEPTGGD